MDKDEVIREINAKHQNQNFMYFVYTRNTPVNAVILKNVFLRAVGKYFEAVFFSEFTMNKLFRKKENVAGMYIYCALPALNPQLTKDVFHNIYAHSGGFKKH